MPRYKLEVDQELVFHGTSEFKYESGGNSSTNDVTFWVTQKNADGSWRLVFVGQSTFAQLYKGSRGPGPRTEALCDSFDLMPDGRIARAPKGTREQGVVKMFYRLPADAKEAANGWQSEDEPGDKAVYKMTHTDAKADTCTFVKNDRGLFSEIYDISTENTVTFDTRRGLVTRAETKTAQTYGVNGKGTGETKLVSTQKKPHDWITQLAGDVEAFVKAREIGNDAITEAGKGTVKPTNALQWAQQALTDARARIKLPLVKPLVDLQEKQFKQYGEYLANKKDEDSILDKPAPGWDVVDIDGGKHSLKGYEGKVVVMDFWYRGCGWCIKAMPQIKEVVEQYRGKPVAVLGMNTDRQEKDARFVVDKLKLNYPTLKAEEVPPKYGVHAFPTLLVIDKKGVVRHQHVGYSPTLREELTKNIDALLKE